VLSFLFPVTGSKSGPAAPPRFRTIQNCSKVLPPTPWQAERAVSRLRGPVTIGGAPRWTPAAIVERLNSEINAGLADAKLKARLAELGYATLASSPAEFVRFIGQETEKWAKVLKFAGIKAE
jgi:hypothetical protein